MSILMNMAMMLEDDDVPDYVLASKYYKEFADKGNGIACFRLTKLMVKGQAYEVEWSIGMAVDYLEKAAKSGVLEAGLLNRRKRTAYIGVRKI